MPYVECMGRPHVFLVKKQVFASFGAEKIHREVYNQCILKLQNPDRKLNKIFGCWLGVMLQLLACLCNFLSLSLSLERQRASKNDQNKLCK